MSSCGSAIGFSAMAVLLCSVLWGEHFLVTADVNVPVSMPSELKCSGCWVISRQYSREMKATSNPTTIQTGHRLDKDNKVPRKALKESELRVILVVEKLCDRHWIEKWHIGETNGTKYFTMDPNDHASTRDSEGYFPVQRNVATMLDHFCSLVVEEQEEDIEDLIRAEESAKAFRLRVCQELTGFCKNSSDPTPKRWKSKVDKDREREEQRKDRYATPDSDQPGIIDVHHSGSAEATPAEDPSPSPDTALAPAEAVAEEKPAAAAEAVADEKPAAAWPSPETLAAAAAAALDEPKKAAENGNDEYHSGGSDL
eukprot:RCo028942